MSDEHGPGPRRGSPLRGVISLLIGVGLVVLANETKLTAGKALLGGFYVKDQYRVALMIGGYALVALSVLLVLLSSSTTTDPTALRSLTNLVTLLAILGVGGGAMIYAAYKNAQHQAASTASTSFSSPPPPGPAQVSSNSTDYPSPCTLYLSGHDAQLTLSGPNAPADCAAFATNASSSGQTWTTNPQSPTGSLTQVCNLTLDVGAVTVEDDGGQTYGQQACNTFSRQGWTTQPATSTATSGTSTSQPPVAASPGAGSLPSLVAGQWTGIRPSSIYFSADGGNIVGKIHWSSWTSTGAVGEGISDIQSCVPDCASGPRRAVTTSITLSNPHDNVFEQMTETRDGTTSTYDYIRGPWPGGAS